MSGGHEASYAITFLKNIVLAGLPRPERPPQTPDPAPDADTNTVIDADIEIIIWQGDLRKHTKRRNSFLKETRKAFATIWDMCSPVLRGKLQQLQNFDNMEVQRNLLVLLEVVSNAVCGREEHNQPVYSLVKFQKMLFTYKQGPHQSNKAFKEEFEVLWDNFEQQGGYVAPPGPHR